MITLTLVAAIAKNGVIGSNNRLPWNLPEDLRHFKKLTWGKPVIMGRKTFDSLPHPLPGRRNIVVTRSQEWYQAGVEAVTSLDEALALVGRTGEACLIGGADMYRQGLPYVNRMCLTEVNAELNGDTFFPVFDRTEWVEVQREEHFCHLAGMSYAFVEYIRKSKPVKTI